MTVDTNHQTAPHSDALVLFGFTGDLANKKIFPALYAMARRGELVVQWWCRHSKQWQRMERSAGAPRAADGVSAGRADCADGEPAGGNLQCVVLRGAT